MSTVAAVIAVTMLAILSIALARQLTVDALFVAVFAPMLPAFVLSIRQIVEHSEAASRLETLHAHAEALWPKVLGGLARHDSSRILQDEIFESRRKNPPVFDWVFRRVRRHQEEQMRHGADELVAEARRDLHGR